MARNVRTNVKKMVNHTIGVGKSPDLGIIVPLVSKFNIFQLKLFSKSNKLNADAVSQ